MMVKSKEFDDPLNDIDPIMEQAFSGNNSVATEIAGKDTSPVQEPVETHEVANVEFPDLKAPSEPTEPVNQSVFKNIPVTVSVELGRSHISLKEVLELSEGSIIELQRLVGEPLDLVVNGQIVAQGEVVAIDNNYGLRITNVASKSE